MRIALASLVILLAAALGAPGGQKRSG